MLYVRFAPIPRVMRTDLHTHRCHIYTRTFPALKRKPFPVIEHGRDFPDIMPLARTPKPEEKLRILVPGQLTPHKGADFIARLVELDKGEHLEFHFLGTLPPAYRHLGTWHGPYERDDFASHVRRLECHVIGIFSIWAETYCHTLSEAWACGMPVVASNLGAMRERIDTHGGGWLIDVTKPLDAYVALTNIREHPEDYTRKAAKAQASNVRTIGDMADDYQRLYDSIKAARRVFTRKSLLQRKNSA